MILNDHTGASHAPEFDANYEYVSLPSTFKGLGTDSA